MVSGNAVIVKDPEILGGAPVFRGTRVPFQALLDYLEGGLALRNPQCPRWSLPDPCWFANWDEGAAGRMPLRAN